MMQYESIEEYTKFSSRDYLSNNYDDLIFNVTPFIASLVDSLECSFFTEKDLVIIADLNEDTLYELMYRLSQCNLLSSKIDCVSSKSYNLTLAEEEMRNCDDSTSENRFASLKMLKEMVKSFTGIPCSVSLLLDEVHITNVALESMDTIAKTLKFLNVKPKRVSSDSNSLYSFELNRDDIFTQQINDESLKQIKNNSEYFSLLRSLREGLAEPTDYSNNIANAETLLSPFKDNGRSFHSLPNNSFNSQSQVRPRGRPRKFALFEDKPKRKRGRPRLSDLHSLFSVHANTNGDSPSTSESAAITE